MSAEKASDNRARTWAAIVYPESAPENWRDILDACHIEWAESPLHEFDTNPGGEVKKAHWHIAMSFDGKKSYEQVQALLAPLNCPAPQKCHSLKGEVRYFAHLDNPEKHQYSVSDIIGHGGFDVAAALAPSSSQRYDMIAAMQQFCRENGIIEFQDLCDYARENERDTWFPLLCDSCAMIMTNYIKSARHRREHGGGRCGAPASGGAGPHTDDERFRPCTDDSDMPF